MNGGRGIFVGGCLHRERAKTRIDRAVPPPPPPPLLLAHENSLWDNVAQISTSFHSSFPLETTNKTGQRKHPDDVFSILFSQKQSAFLCLCCCCSHPPNESLMKEVPLLLCQVCKCSKELATALFWAWAERSLPLPLLRALLLLLFHPRCKNEVMCTWLSSILITNMNNNFFTLLNNVKSSEVCVVKLLLPELC